MISRVRARAITVLQGLLYLAILAGCVGGGLAAFAALRPRVTVTTVIRGPVIRAVYATGTISPVREYPIRAKRAGTLEKVFVDKGDKVAAGQQLAAVVDSALTFAAEKARAELAEKTARADEANSPVLAELDARIRGAQEQLVVAKREEGRLRQLIESSSRSTTDLDRAIDRTQAYTAALESLKGERASKLLELRRDVAFAQSAARTAEFDLGELQLSSPIDGVVLDRPTSPGTRVPINEVLMRVADVTPERLVMRAAVDEEDITGVSVGQRVIMTLYAFEGGEFEGRVKTIYAEADASRRTFEVDVEVRKPSDRFQAGMTGELAFVVQERADAAVLPATALQNGTIYVVRDGRIEKAAATVGVRSVDRIEVIDGVGPDAEVIVSPVTEAMVGKHVRTEPIDPAKAVTSKLSEAAPGTFKNMR